MGLLVEGQNRMDFQAYTIISAFFVVAALIVGLLGWRGWKSLLKKKNALEAKTPGVMEAYTFNPRLIVYTALFSILSISLLFLFPWAFSFKSLGCKGFFIILFFLGILGAGLFYSWKKDTLE